MSQPRSRHSRKRPSPVVMRGRLGLVSTVFLIAGVVGVLLWNYFHSPRKAASQGGDKTRIKLNSDEFRDETVYAKYGGTASCESCHEEAFALWKGSNHELAERAVEPALDQKAFDPSRSFHSGTQTTTVNWSNGTGDVTAPGLSGKPELHLVSRVIGNRPLRQFLVTFPGGRLQTLEASYDPRSNDWFNVYGNEDRQPGEWGHWTGRGMNWNNMCASCHNTRVRKNYDSTNDTYQTTMAERSVGCEACHGPLKSHNEWQKQFGKSGRKDPTITKLPRDRILDSCGFCHARRGEFTGDFKPGDNFFDHMRLTVVDASNIYYPDGQVHDEDYEYSAFLGSRMHYRGVICIDCHNPHSAKTILPGNWLCMKCHDGSFTNAPVIQPVAHSRHRVFGYDTNGVVMSTDLLAYGKSAIKETGGECVNCHMPQTPYMQRHWRHDHGFTIPDPWLTKQAGVPNACNRCHQDKDTDWAMKFCNEWYRDKMVRPTRARAMLIEAARQRKSGAWTGLVEVLGTNEIPYWRAVAGGLLEPWVGESAVREALLKGLKDTNALVRAECAQALEPLATADFAVATNALGKLLLDPIRAVRLAAAWGLRSRLEPNSGPARELEHSLAINADQPAGQVQLAIYLLARGEANEAARHYAKAIEWDPNSAPIRHDYAVLLSGLDRSQQAVTQLEAACRLEPQNADFQYKLGLAWNQLGQTAKTIDCLRAAVRLEPNHAVAWYNLGLAFNTVGRTDEALAALVRAESIDSADARSPYARATILARLGRIEEARQAGQRALEIDPGYDSARALVRELARVPK